MSSNVIVGVSFGATFHSKKEGKKRTEKKDGKESRLIRNARQFGCKLGTR